MSGSILCCDTTYNRVSIHSLLTQELVNLEGPIIAFIILNTDLYAYQYNHVVGCHSNGNISMTAKHYVTVYNLN